MTPLQRNYISHLRGTLEDLASSERQVKHKNAVPFVHVPIELFAQWDNYIRMIHEAPWFRTLFSPSDQASLLAYDAKVERFRELRRDQFPDVEEILADPEWHKLMQAAGELLAVLRFPLDDPEQA